MRELKTFISDGSFEPTDEEISEALRIAKTSRCVVRLVWTVQYSGTYTLEVTENMTFGECKNKLPKVYPL